MEKLYCFSDHFYKNFDYVVGELNGKYPSDLQIISNIFFTFLTMETLTEAERRNNLLKKKIVYGYRDVIGKNFRCVVQLIESAKIFRGPIRKMCALNSAIQVYLNLIMTSTQVESIGQSFR